MRKFNPLKKIKTKFLKSLIKVCFLGILFALLIIFLSNFWVEKSTETQIYNTIETIPHNKVGIILGTSKYLTNGYINLYYQYRIDAAAELFHAKKIDFIIVSGDNSKKNYNEPKQMKQSLIEKGVPSDKIQEDYAGLRTLDSILRAKEVFGQDHYTIISQPFHNKRALFISNYYSHQAIAFNAQKVTQRYGFKTQLREYPARVKAVLDLYLLKTKAKFYGEKIKLEI
ncbi:MAG: vancomycin high temperature exclusion protein [Flavobacteriales bacterium]